MSIWYVIEDSLDRREKLIAARVPVSDLNVRKPYIIKGLTFPGEEKEKVFEILGLKDQRFSEIQTEMDNVVFLFPVGECGVFLEDSVHMEAWEHIKPVLHEFAVKLGVDIYVSNPHGYVSSIKSEDGKLFIRFWSTPKPTRKKTIPQIFGVEVEEAQEDAKSPTGSGVPILDSCGLTVAEVHGGTLYILFDLPHGRNGDNISFLMRSIMEQYLEQYLLSQKDPEEYGRLVSEIAKRELDHSRKMYVHECGRRLTLSVSRTEGNLKSVQEQIEEAQKNLTNLVREEQKLRRGHQQLLESSDELEARFANEFDKLQAVPGVTKTLVDDGIISIFTDQIDIEYEGQLYDIGKFRIDIYTEGGNGGVTCHNLTRQVQRDGCNYNHPHVKGDGSCCFGNIANGISILIGEYEYSVLAQMIIEYLRQVNPGDWWCHIKRWPLKEK